MARIDHFFWRTIHYSKVLDLFRIFRPRRLSVLNYHRVGSRASGGFIPNISASPEDFSRQMDYLKKYYSVVSLVDVIEWTYGKKTLPRNPVLITFDDGYRDNYINAYPILKQYDFPFVVFLTSGYIGQTKLFYWDLVAYCFEHTTYDHATLPYAGQKSWTDKESRQSVMDAWIELLKLRTEDEKQRSIASLPEILNISVPDAALGRLMLNWDEVREMCANGIDFGSHTITHPILTRVSLDHAFVELVGSKAEIEAEIGKPILSLAYPNGKSADFDEATLELAKRAGYKVGFTLLPGPTTQQEAINSPFSIRRIYIDFQDDLPRFAAKLVGARRFASRIRTFWL